MHKRLGQVLVALLLGTLSFGLTGFNATPAHAESGTIFLPFASTQRDEGVSTSCGDGCGDTTVKVFKFDDLNGDGYKDDNESFMAGWEFTAIRGEQTVTGTTEDHSGEAYVSWSLPGGWWQICETLQEGWFPTGYTDAQGCQWVYLYGDYNTLTFGNTQEPAHLIVKKESPDDGGSLQFDFKIERFFSFFYFTFDEFGLPIGGEQTFDIAPGGYKVDEVGAPNGWSLTNKYCHNVTEENVSAATYSDLYIQAGETYECVFTNKLDRGKIKVWKYNDLDANNKWNYDETSLPGWEFIVSGTTISGTAVTTSGVTSGDGYVYIEVPLGVYEVCEVPQPGWQPSSGSLCQSDIDISYKGDVDKVYFGNYRESEIVVKKFTNVLTDQEFPFSVTITNGEIITGETPFSLTNGSVYTLTVKPGDYAVSETVDSLTGWALTDSSCYTEEIVLNDRELRAATFEYPICIASGDHECPPPPPPPTLPGGTRLVCEFHNELEAEPVVTKDVSASYTTTHTWEISKTVDPLDQSAFAGDTISWTWSVTVSQESSEGNYTVDGQISVANQLADGSLSGTLSDKLDDGTAAEITGCSGDDVTYSSGILTIGGGATAVCDYLAHPSSRDALTNTATFTSDQVVATGNAALTWEEQVVGDKATVDDDQEPDFGDGLVINAEDMPKSWTETQEYTCSTNPADYADDGKYSDFRENTAVVSWDDGLSDDAYAKTTFTCYGPVVSKTAETDWTRTYTWDIEKSVSPAAHSGYPGDTFQSAYTVTVDQTTVDSGFSAAGTISVSNPAGAPGSITVDVADQVGGSTATVDCGAGSTSLTVAPGNTESCSYTMALPDATDLTNTATVTFNEIDFTASAAVEFGEPTVVGYPTINVSDVLQWRCERGDGFGLRRQDVHV